MDLNNYTLQIINGSGAVLRITDLKSNTTSQSLPGLTRVIEGSPTNLLLSASSERGADLYSFNLSLSKPTTLTNGNYTCKYLHDSKSKEQKIIITANSYVPSIWDTSTSTLKFNGATTHLKGVTLIGFEDLLSNIGIKTFVTYNKSTPENLFILNKAMLDATAKNFTAIKIVINGNYYLDRPTPSWVGNYENYPNLSLQYQNLAAEIITYFSAKGIVSIIELFWDSDETKEPHDALLFWNTFLKRHKENPLILCELANELEDLSNNYSLWRDGAHISGIKTLYEAVRGQTGYPLLLKGAFEKKFHEELKPQGILYNISAKGKLPTDLESLALTMPQVPLIITKIGEAPLGYLGSYNGINLPYQEAMIQVCNKYNLSYILD